MNSPPLDRDAFARERRAMVENQLRRRDIRDERVLAAMGRVPRHAFVPPGAAQSAYADHPLGIGESQTISQPYMVAAMTQALAVRPGHRVLEVGTGSGYQTAVLLEMGARVYTIERHASLSERARRALEAAGYAGARFRVGDGTLGWPEEAPFDRILVTAGAPETPPALAAQLADGGLMVLPLGRSAIQHLVTVVRRGDDLVEQKGMGCVFVRLVGEQGWQEGT